MRETKMPERKTKIEKMRKEIMMFRG